MNARAFSLILFLLAGCGAQVAVTPPLTGGTDLRAPDAQFHAERPGLRRVGYRNCDGYSMELLVPRQVARDPRGQGIWWRITPYLPGRNAGYQITVPDNASMPGWRTERRGGNGWQAMPRPTAAGTGVAPRRQVLTAAGIGASLPVRLDLAAVIGLPPDQLTPGSYRVQAPDFTVETPAGGRCAMRPFWVFDIQ